MDVIVRIHLSDGRMSGVGGVAGPEDFAKALAYCLRFRSLLFGISVAAFLDPESSILLAPMCRDVEIAERLAQTSEYGCSTGQG